MKKISISSTMGPGVKIALASVGAGGAARKAVAMEFRRTIAGTVRDCWRPQASRKSGLKILQHRQGMNRICEGNSAMFGFGPWGSI